MTIQFNHSRLKLARIRRKLTLTELAKRVGLTSRMVSEYEKDYCESVPPPSTIEAFSKALDYPSGFFFIEQDLEEISPDTVSFRSLKSMRAAQKNAAIGAANLGLMISEYFEARFNLPEVNIPNLRGFEPEAAAAAIREYWNIGSKSISNVIHLLEINGIKVFSLSENAQSVDAFSFWKDEQPFVYLNTQKSGERGRFDAAHELGHLLLHRHGTPQGRDVEAEADSFASYFLMPRRSVLSHKNRFPTLSNIIELKRNWKVSAMALIMQMRNVGALTEWQHRTLIIEASKAGLRTEEINGIERESSMVIKRILLDLKNDGVSIQHLAKDLFLPIEEVTNLLFKFGVIRGTGSKSVNKEKPKLQLVDS